MARRTSLLAVLIVLGLVAMGVESIKFDVRPNTERRLKEELSRDVLVVGNYSVDPAQSALRIKFTIVDPTGAEIFTKSADSGHFSFTTEYGGEFQFCFVDETDSGRFPHGFTRRVALDVRTGVDAKDYTELAGKENLTSLEVTMRMIEDGVDEVLNDLKYLRKREERMRDTNESTNSRVAWLSTFSVITMVAVGGWQIYYLKRYFQQKKIL